MWSSAPPRALDHPPRVDLPLAQTDRDNGGARTAPPAPPLVFDELQCADEETCSSSTPSFSRSRVTPPGALDWCTATAHDTASASGVGSAQALYGRACAEISAGRPVLLSIPSDWNNNPPRSPYAHMVAGYDVSSNGGTLTAMNP